MRARVREPVRLRVDETRKKSRGIGDRERASAAQTCGSSGASALRSGQRGSRRRVTAGMR